MLWSSSDELQEAQNENVEKFLQAGSLLIDILNPVHKTPHRQSRSPTTTEVFFRSTSSSPSSAIRISLTVSASQPSDHRVVLLRPH